jgi:hypothetical protein
MKLLIAAIIPILLTGCYETTRAPRLPSASPLEIASVSQEKRNAAAKLLRSSYKPPAKTNWTALATSMKPGMGKSNLLELLRPFGATVEMTAGSGQSHSEDYRLDDAWLLRCAFNNRSRLMADDTLIRAELVERLRAVWVEPSTNFSGIWITYFVNGEKAREVTYKDGRYSGEFIAYHSDGSKAYTQHFNHHIAEGANTGFYPSGRTNYLGWYKSNKPVGTWIWYNEDGSIQTTRDFSKP